MDKVAEAILIIAQSTFWRVIAVAWTSSFVIDVGISLWLAPLKRELLHLQVKKLEGNITKSW